MANNRKLSDEYFERLDKFDPDSLDHATLDYLKTTLNNLAKKTKDVKSEVRGACSTRSWLIDLYRLNRTTA